MKKPFTNNPVEKADTPPYLRVLMRQAEAQLHPDKRTWAKNPRPSEEWLSRKHPKNEPSQER